MIELGGNISLVGFSEVDKGSMVIVKKIIGSYGRKFSDVCKNFDNLTVSVKTIHNREKSEKYEVAAKLMNNGIPVNSNIEDRNLFLAIDSVLKKVEKQV